MIRAKTYPLPASIRALCVQDSDGDYDIVINTNLCPKARLRALKHELEHIRRGDFELSSADDAEKRNASRADNSRGGQGHDTY